MQERVKVYRRLWNEGMEERNIGIQFILKKLKTNERKK